MGIDDCRAGVASVALPAMRGDAEVRALNALEAAVTRSSTIFVPRAKIRGDRQRRGKIL